MNKFLLLLLPFSLMALTMEEMVQETLDKNPNMQKDIGSYRAVQYDLDKAKSGWKPNVDFRADVGYEHTDKSYVQTNNQALDTTSDLMRNSASIVATENLFEGLRLSLILQNRKVVSCLHVLIHCKTQMHWHFVQVKFISKFFVRSHCWIFLKRT